MKIVIVMGEAKKNITLTTKIKAKVQKYMKIK
jgi:hypothetical protein